MKPKKDNIVLFLRKFKKGQNSIKRFAEFIAENIDGCVIKEFPEYSTSLKGIVKNIRFARKEQGNINHVMQHTEGYILPFIHGKKIITVHDLGTMATHGKLAYLALYLLNIVPSILFAHIIQVNSEQTKNEMLGRFHLCKDKLVKVYHCSMCHNRAMISKPQKDYIKILQVGTATRKNLENVIRAMNGLNGKLTIVGVLSDEQEKLLKENLVSYENFFDIAVEKLEELYEKTDIVTFISFYEGLGLITIEAQMAGKPVITSNSVAVLREVGQDSVCYVNPNSSEEIRRAIEEIRDDDVYRNALIQKGLENWKRFSPEKFIQEMKTLYNC